ncbi:Anion exchange protein 3,Anion exchange protein 4,Anion exchange protein 2,Sodium bicarbonate cotransporter 3,Sodium-driven chloride bicarbonate exchanger,Electroneutral sodium bicarbonate exchanger 1,Band 3 anion transport protein,Electrogenic sodium bicarbonate cotransporter 1,Electrogenic sodium bicarbonate cotransporter 4 [Mytilus coruscus]|uniref:Anion exchange protein n=1 Tax=Mytilus coruscus TaxID=42192 RepID=A0A6J8CFC2_MYTCO|nr:Anion exchange protein 3,Anion exchange protein 4,Anion exchange protein 2,Sodium bicarbonate cotransporter 3,Sodium-driven chloride bicarbonate exchanger,Electroneutral sodium bicarbonate exchanger 1,Band 3 anion transport protein,Electrogenic sodium bicarbonate cotransporter 1,Electrogenic sodium bicarbonate cotransporter 4 [Mytilus coruscus]
MADPDQVESGVIKDHRMHLGDEDYYAEESQHRLVDPGYIGVRLPSRPRRPKRHHSRKRKSKPKIEATPKIPSDPTFMDPASLTPSEQIQALITENEEESHDIFCQLDTLFKLGNEMQWREAARWVKYEEDVEDSGNRWSKPHVASLSLHSLFELRSQLLNGAVMLDMDAYHISQVSELLLDNLIANKLLEDTMRDDIKQTILSPHIHAHLKRRKTQADDLGRKKSIARTFSEIGRSFSKTNTREDSMSKLKGNPNSVPNMEKFQVNGDLKESPSSAKHHKEHHQHHKEHHQLNQPFMKKIPDGAEAANIWVGEMEALKYPVTAFIRLSEARPIGDLTEVPLPTRFIFIHLGPSGTAGKCLETGRAISTIMVDEQGRKENKPQPAGPKEALMFIEEEESHVDPTLVRTGRLFGGLVADIKRKIPWYPSDFKDCLHMQCVASVIYLYLATLTPNVTFGGLLGLATDNYMGTMECILTAALTGILFALFSGQPLNILGSTGPMLVLEMIIFKFCKDREWDFLPLRAWVGLWSAFFLLIIVAFDLSALVKYITRFTEESFACLIAIIFIVEAFKKLFAITKKHPFNIHPEIPLDYTCGCYHPNFTMPDPNNSTLMNITSDIGYTLVDMTKSMSDLTFNKTDSNVTDYSVFLTKKDCEDNGGIRLGSGCDTIVYHDNVFFLSIILFLFTFGIAWTLKMAKTSRFFPTFVRQYLSDFAVLISILCMVLLDYFIGVPTPKLEVPAKFAPSSPHRGWFINPFSPKNPWWTILVAAGPAIVAVILIFMDQQITAVIVNRKENKLRKGNGYHLDMMVVTVCIIICSLFGLPWYVAATVSALAHIMSLRKESESAAPGEKPTFLGVREQRVTALLVGILSGVSVFMTPILTIIPMPVLYGVFLYMGVAALKGMQLTDRILILLMPTKYQPDHIFLRHVKTTRVHLFTFIQILCLAVLWAIKTTKSISIVFPVMVLGTCFVRKAIEKVFSFDELKWLDDIMPDDSKKKKEDEEELKDDDDDEETESLLGDEKRRLNEMKAIYGQGDKFSGKTPFAQDRVNITEEVNKTGIWLQVRRDSMPVIRDPDQSNGGLHNRKNGSKDKKDKKPAEKTSFFVGEDERTPLKEEHEEDDMV